MKAVPIGKGMYRIIVRSKEKRKRLSKIPEVIVESNRVIFPEWLTSGKPMPDDDKKAFSAWCHWTKDDALFNSGLIGPVKIFSTDSE